MPSIRSADRRCPARAASSRCTTAQILNGAAPEKLGAKTLTCPAAAASFIASQTGRQLPSSATVRATRLHRANHPGHVSNDLAQT